MSSRSKSMQPPIAQIPTTNKTVRAIIVEDEMIGLNTIINMLAKNCPNVEIIGIASNNEGALELLKDPSLQPDVAFLDINLPDGLVFKMLNELEEINFDIIFVTAFINHAAKAAWYSSIAFVLKPIDPDELIEAVARIRPGKNQVRKKLEHFNELKNTNSNSFNKISISALDGIHFINLTDILRFEAADNYTHIHLTNGDQLIASKTIKSYEDQLLPNNFYRVHKRHVVNLNYMRKFIKGDGGHIIMDDGHKIEVSRRRRPAFMELLKLLQDNNNG